MLHAWFMHVYTLHHPSALLLLVLLLLFTIILMHLSELSSLFPFVVVLNRLSSARMNNLRGFVDWIKIRVCNLLLSFFLPYVISSERMNIRDYYYYYYYDDYYLDNKILKGLFFLVVLCLLLEGINTVVICSRLSLSPCTQSSSSSAIVNWKLDGFNLVIVPLQWVREGGREEGRKETVWLIPQTTRRQQGRMPDDWAEQ